MALPPLHDAFRAAELLQGILSKDPSHELAKLWLAYAYVYDFMDEGALRDAVELSDQLVEQSTAAEIQEGALLLKATALRDLGEPDPAVELLNPTGPEEDAFGGSDLILELSNVVEDPFANNANHSLGIFARLSLGSTSGGSWYWVALERVGNAWKVHGVRSLQVSDG